MVVVATLEEACAWANAYAPEHLEVHTKDPKSLVPLLTSYGSLFLGEAAAEVLWEYDSGAVEGVEELDETYSFRIGYTW